MKLNYIASALLGLSVITTGCGGGGGGGTAAPTTLSGTAAAGAPIIGTVIVKGALGETSSALIEADGTYDVDVTGLTAPYRLRAQGTVGGRTYKLHSYAVESDVGNTVNITPFTDLIIANVAGQIAETFFDEQQQANPLDEAEVEAQEAELQAKLQNVFNAVGVGTAIDLLRDTFSADHSGLDAALDIIRVEQTSANIVTITNLVENTSITDDISNTGETDTLTVNDPTALQTSATDTQQIAALFESVSTAFAASLPSEAQITDLFATDFLEEGLPKAAFLTDITTDPGMVGFLFSGVVVSDLTATTATVTFNFGANGVFEPEAETWTVAKDATLGWQLRGDQRIVETYFSFHCNDYDGFTNDTPTPWGCGINTQFWDELTSDNPGNTVIASGTVSIFNAGDDTTTATPKAVIYLGTPAGGTAGDVQVYNESNDSYQGDYKGLGTAAGEINPSIFVAGDIIQYDLYTADLDTTSSPGNPAVVGSPVATYTDTLAFAPSPTTWSDSSNKMPTATSATQSAIQAYTIGNGLTIGWNLATGTRIEEVMVRITDSAGDEVEIWDWMYGSTATSVTYSAADLDTSALLQTDTQYELRVRIYAQDEENGQTHSRDYAHTIAGPAAQGGGGGGSSLTCGYETTWDDTADGGLGAPVTGQSFADFEALLADCGTAVSFTAADVAGTAYNDGGGEITTFNALGGAAGTQADPGTGTHDDGAGTVIAMEWYVEAATCTGCTHSYVVTYTDDTIETTNIPAGFWFRGTAALYGVTGTPGQAGSVYSFYHYDEQSNYSDADRAAGTDGDIWLNGDTLQ